MIDDKLMAARLANGLRLALKNTVEDDPAVWDRCAKLLEEYELKRDAQTSAKHAYVEHLAKVIKCPPQRPGEPYSVFRLRVMRAFESWSVS